MRVYEEPSVEVVSLKSESVMGELPGGTPGTGSDYIPD